MAKREDHAAIQAKYLELARKYAELVERSRARPLSMAATASTGARLASIAVAAFDHDGKLLYRSSRWNGMVPAALARSVALEIGAERRTDVRQFRAAGRRGATLIVRIECVDGVSIALAAEEPVTWVGDDERARRRLWQSERLRVLGQLAASVAHDLSSTLRSIRYLLSSFESDEVVRLRCGRALEAMGRGLDGSSAIVQRLHDFARTGARSLQLVRMATVLQEAIALYRLETEANGGGPPVALRVAPVPPVQASPGELSHVFLNLLRNARDASPPSSAISVGCALAGKVVRISVADRGSGLARSQLSHVFEPFFTTKGEKGTGLGLFICASLVERMGGSIRAGNRPEGGAIFTVELPAVTAPSASADSREEGPARGPPASRPPRRARHARRRSSAG